jgi:hypothetical protein
MSRSLSPCPAEVQVEQLIAEADHITIVVRVFRPVFPCPGCTRLSCRIHSYDERRVADLPWNGIPMKIRLRTRRFVCDTEDCAQRIFTERLPETAETYARRTVRMEQALRWLALALALAGAAGARTANGWVLGSAGTRCRTISDACRWRGSQLRLRLACWAWMTGRSARASAMGRFFAI